MKLTALCTLNDRSIDTMRQVFDSMKGQAFDEYLIVFDQTPVVLADYCIEYWKGDRRVDFVDAPDREPGWRSPVKAWNAGFRKATGDVLYCFSSETVQAEGNIAKAKDMLDDFPNSRPIQAALHGSVSCSCGPTGKEVVWNDGTPGNLFGDAAHPRPLGFIWAAPKKAVLDIGGYDEAFDEGFWFDDDDFWFRMWKAGLDFVFDDSISGIHLHHERPALATLEGQKGILRNQAYMEYKHNNLKPLSRVLIAEERLPGKTIWRHA